MKTKFEDDIDLEPKMVFVGGAPRSGTTLVQRLLDSHPDIVGGPELNALTDIIALHEQLKRNVENERIDFYCDVPQLRSVFSDFIHSFFDPVRERYGAKLVSEKTPSNVLVFDELANIFPDSLFLFVIRDPKDVLASYIGVKMEAKRKNRTPSIELRNLFLSIDHIYKHMNAGHLFCKNNPERAFILKYEDLVDNPYQTAKRLMEFLGVEFREEALKMNGPGQYYFEKRVQKVDSVYYSMRDIQKPIDSISLGKWKKVLSKSTAGLVEKVFQGIAEDYDTGTEKGKGLLLLYNLHKRIIRRQGLLGKIYYKIISRV